MDYKLAMRLTLTLFLFHANLLLAENIGLAKMDAARMVSAAVAARTPQIEFHPELLEQFAIGGKEADALEKSKISSSGGSSLHQYRDYQIF
ncbi:hypothetical protein Bca4012_096970 [Brassica carinata]